MPGGTVTRNITADDKFYLGTNQRFVGTIYQNDGTTPENISSYTELIFVLSASKKGTPDKALITKKMSEGEIAFLTDGIDGKYVIAFLDTDTDGSADKLKADVTYYYSVKRFTPDEILTEGEWLFLASTQRLDA